MRTPPSVLSAVAAALVLGLGLGACSSGGDEPTSPTSASASAVGQDGTQAGDAPALADAPEVGACRDLTPEDVAQPSNDTDPVDCKDDHTAQTFVVGAFPEKVTTGAGYGSSKLGAYIYDECTPRFGKLVGGDDSIVLRSLVSWVWFRPTKDEWADGARWYRCDIVGGTSEAASYRDLPTTARALFSKGPVDAWMQCVRGASISSNPPTPCSAPHDWRAISSVKVGDPKDDYPGNKIVESRSRNLCSTSVGAMLGYPPAYDFAFSWFHAAEWKAGNRRSVCWAKTSK